MESELGTGTTFHIYLPASGKSCEPVDEHEVTLTHGFGRILIMDDEEAIREVAGEMLSMIGYRVDVAESGEEAINGYNRALEVGDPVDVVIMDLTIPGGMGGKEAIVKLREIDPHVRAIVSSGYSNDPIMAHYEDYGFIGILRKPYSAKDLGDAVDQAMKKDRY